MMRHMNHIMILLAIIGILLSIIGIYASKKQKSYWLKLEIATAIMLGLLTLLMVAKLVFNI